MSSDASHPSQPEPPEDPTLAAPGGEAAPVTAEAPRRRRRRKWWQRMLPEPRKVKFVWGLPQDLPGRWRFKLFCPYKRLSANRDGLAISVRGLLGYGVLAGIVAFFIGASFLATALAQQPYNLITYRDIVAPWRWPVLGDLRGRQLIEQGLAEAAKTTSAETAAKLQRGVELHPADRRARLVLARYHLERREQASAEKLLREAGAWPGFAGREYLDRFAEFAFQVEQTDLLLVAVDDALAQPPEMTGATRRWLVQTKLRAFLALDRPADAIAFIQQGNLPDADIAAEYRIMALLELGRAPEAQTAIEAWAAAGGPPMKVVRARARAARVSRDVAALDAAIATWRALEPVSPQPFVEHVTNLALLGQAEAASRTLDDYLFRFGSQADNLLQVALPLVQQADLPLVERVVQHARDQGLWSTSFEVLIVTVAIQRDDWARVESSLARIEPLITRGEGRINNWYHLIRGLASATASPSETAAQALLDFCRNQPPPLDAYRTVLPALIKAGRQPLARKILEVGLQDYPASRFLTRQLAELDGKTTSGT